MTRFTPSFAAASGATANASVPGVSPGTGVTPGMGAVDCNTGTATVSANTNGSSAAGRR